jgi:hypothetical protein
MSGVVELLIVFLSCDDGSVTAPESGVAGVDDRAQTVVVLTVNTGLTHRLGSSHVDPLWKPIRVDQRRDIRLRRLTVRTSHLICDLAEVAHVQHALGLIFLVGTEDPPLESLARRQRRVAVLQHRHRGPQRGDPAFSELVPRRRNSHRLTMQWVPLASAGRLHDLGEYVGDLREFCHKRPS